MVIKIDYKDGTFSWQVAENESSLSSGAASEMGVSLKGTAPSETEAIKAGTAAIRDIKARREQAKNYPKIVEIVTDNHPAGKPRA